MGDNKGQTIFLSVIGIATLLVAIIGATFAYFTTTMTGEKGNVTATTAKLGKSTFTAESVNEVNPVFPGWTSGAKTVTVDLEAGDADVNFACYMYATALTATEGTNALTDFYVTAAGTADAEAGHTLTPTTNRQKFTAVGEASTEGGEIDQNRLLIAKGKLKAKKDAKVSQSFTYTVGMEETGAPQNTQQGVRFTGVVTCELESETFYTNATGAAGQTTNPGSDAPSAD